MSDGLSLTFLSSCQQSPHSHPLLHRQANRRYRAHLYEALTESGEDTVPQGTLLDSPQGTLRALCALGLMELCLVLRVLPGQPQPAAPRGSCTPRLSSLCQHCLSFHVLLAPGLRLSLTSLGSVPSSVTRSVPLGIRAHSVDYLAAFSRVVILCEGKIVKTVSLWENNDSQSISHSINQKSGN